MKELRDDLRPVDGVRTGREDAFWDALCDPARRPFAVELDSPADGNISRFMAGARELRDGGADLITVADSPFARARMDACLTVCKLRRELGIDVMPHITCRDRNLIATQALLMGLSAEDVGKVLLVTGDPIPKDSRGEVKNVYHFNSRTLIAFVNSLNEATQQPPFRIFAALNVNANSFPIQLDLARRKEDNGAVGFLTQPVFTDEALDNLRLARETLKGRLLGGIMPIVSHRNALFLNSEVAGIRIDAETVSRYEGLDRAGAEELALELSCSMARRMRDFVDGYFLITPFSRTALMVRIMEQLRSDSIE